MNYKERAEIIKALSEQSYFDAKTKPQPRKKDVRIGSVDGLTGQSQVFHADGGFSTNGIRVFDAAPPSDRFVRGQQSTSANSMALGYRDYRASAPLVRVEESNALLGQITLLGFDISETRSGVDESVFSVGAGIERNIEDDTINTRISIFAPPPLNQDLCNTTGNIDDSGGSVTLNLNAPFTLRPPLGEGNVNSVTGSMILTFSVEELVDLIPELLTLGTVIFADSANPNTINTETDVDSLLGLSFTYKGIQSNRDGYLGIAYLSVNPTTGDDIGIIDLTDNIYNPPSGDAVYTVDFQRY